MTDFENSKLLFRPWLSLPCVRVVILNSWRSVLCPVVNELSDINDLVDPVTLFEVCGQVTQSSLQTGWVLLGLNFLQLMFQGPSCDHNISVQCCDSEVILQCHWNNLMMPGCSEAVISKVDWVQKEDARVSFIFNFNLIFKISIFLFCHVHNTVIQQHVLLQFKYENMYLEVFFLTILVEMKREPDINPESSNIQISVAGSYYSSTVLGIYPYL